MTEDGELQVSFEESLGLQFETERIQSLFLASQVNKEHYREDFLNCLILLNFDFNYLKESIIWKKTIKAFSYNDFFKNLIHTCKCIWSKEQSWQGECYKISDDINVDKKWYKISKISLWNFHSVRKCSRDIDSQS